METARRRRRTPPALLGNRKEERCSSAPPASSALQLDMDVVGRRGSGCWCRPWRPMSQAAAQRRRRPSSPPIPIRKRSPCSVRLADRRSTVGGMSKGSGMIHPNMGTMLAFVTSDAAIEQPLSAADTPGRGGGYLQHDLCGRGYLHQRYLSGAVQRYWPAMIS